MSSSMTPYASFNAMINDITQNGGAWYDFVPIRNLHAATQYPNSTIIPHQTMGGVADMMALTGEMAVNLLIPSNLVQVNQIFTYTFTYTICVVKPDGDTRAMGGFFIFAVEWCPKMTNINYTSSMPLGNNLWTYTMDTEASLAKLSFSTAYIGNIKLTIAVSPSNSTTGSTPTIATFSLSTVSSAPVNSPTGTSNAQVTGRIVSALTTVTFANGSTTVSTLTTLSAPSTSSPTSSSVIQSIQGSSFDPSSSHPATISSNSAESNKVNVAAIVGGTLGGLALLGLILFSTFLYVRQRNRRARGEETRKRWLGHWKWPGKGIMRRSSVRKDIGVTEPEPFIPDTLRQTSRRVMPRKIER